jgi:mRNA-degrading endonuclease RelE of RelBE toxin-antitoxin system
VRALEWTLRARNEINALDRRIAVRIYKALKRYAATGAGDVKQLKAPILLYRLRVGDWRVIFTLEEKGLLRIARVAHLSEIYR